MAKYAGKRGTDHRRNKRHRACYGKASGLGGSSGAAHGAAPGRPSMRRVRELGRERHRGLKATQLRSRTSESSLIGLKTEFQPIDALFVNAGSNSLRTV